MHYAVNHSENFVDPDTGAHTQTVEGFWRQCKSYLPSFGLKPKYLRIYWEFSIVSILQTAKAGLVCSYVEKH